MEEIDKLVNDIKNLRIQGATAVARAALEGITLAVNQTPAGASLPKYVAEVGRRLAFARPTEPLARNALRFILQDAPKQASVYLNRIKAYQKLMEQAESEIIAAGLPLFAEGGTYLTHCHASSVAALFAAVRQKGLNFRVIATETRPRFQGRITAQELVNEGVPVTMIVDSAAVSVLEGQQGPIAAVIVGADLLGINGFVNKVGTLTIVRACERQNVPLYIVATLLKFDPRPITEEIYENRPAAEIWPGAPKGVNFFTPAFDFIPYNAGIRLVTEAGVITKDAVANEAYRLYPFLVKE